MRFATELAPDLHIHDRGHEPAAALLRFTREFPGRILFAADTTGRREVLSETLWAFGIRPRRFESWSEFQASASGSVCRYCRLEEGFVAGERVRHPD